MAEESKNRSREEYLLGRGGVVDGENIKESLELVAIEGEDKSCCQGHRKSYPELEKEFLDAVHHLYGQCQLL